jgi:hypothetical protein
MVERTQYETEVRALLEKNARSTVATNLCVFDAYKAELQKWGSCNNKYATAAKLFAGISLVFEEVKGKRKEPCKCMVKSEISDLYYAPIDFATRKRVNGSKTRIRRSLLE